MKHEAPHQLTVADVADRLGRDAIMSRLGVGKSAVSLACVAGRFPSSWFEVIEAMCADAGIACPKSLFHFKHAKAARKRAA